MDENCAKQGRLAACWKGLYPAEDVNADIDNDIIP